ncbi:MULTISPECIES: DUF3107 domain-containing protein [Brevibacterium]|uniref:DUF3107 domain-containing protein n=1 Tax=Brevibacterium pityocampae TaxID=506594 RepID=A0ABP8JII1_9MICO|nr:MULTISPECIES: DUF3107 domain-containing protein [Actinomycetes]MCK1802734.1 DUF3107 domain-containing protein [Brevibacterium sp. R8603A2]MCX0276268.1 DUF3107 domain-containing protein [Nocardia zapadnayensis]QCP05436.1 DUF3107 domain-containing protein [Brevibacterium sp. CS2]
MEIRIGVQNAPRELVLESTATADEVNEQVKAALQDGGMLSLADAKGRQVFVPAAALAYVETGEEQQRRVGFGVG